MVHLLHRLYGVDAPGSYAKHQTSLTAVSFSLTAMLPSGEWHGCIFIYNNFKYISDQ